MTKEEILQLFEAEIANADQLRTGYLDRVTAHSYDNDVTALEETFKSYKYHQIRYEALTLLRDKLQ